ncbi:MAG: hypothetical protein JO317_07070 [Verrucomicrobiae bacterium]|nr:hypothetical protein [Verrucomicrobiae bacterium]
MSKKNEPGPLASSALTLEEDFQEVERIRSALRKFTTGDETDLDHARELLAKFGQIGTRIGEQIQIHAACLQEATRRASAASEEVKQSAEVVEQKSQQRAAMTERFQALAQKVQEVSNSFADIGQGPDEAADRKRLPEFHQQLLALADQAVRMKEEARAAGYRELERKADTMDDRLRFSAKKIRKLAEQQS